MNNPGLDFFKQIFDPSPSQTKGMFKGHQIDVRLSLKQLKLYIDGQAIESVEPSLWPRGDVALVSGSIREGDHIHVVEVYGRSGLFRAKIKICVNGKKIAGDEF